MKHFFSFLLGVVVMFNACDNNADTSNDTKVQLDKNPAAAGFDLENSDAKAIDIADAVVKAMGGRYAYDTTQYISWNFFGSRTLWWDKHSGDVRIESKRDNYKVKVNIHDMSGEVLKDSILHTNVDSLNKYLEKAKNAWINDSYWLVMPYKLKDSGVTLKYLGEEMSDTLNADILELTFKDIGKTPDNKYHIYVDKETRLVNQWAFFTKASDAEARFKTPWQNYKSHGGILLSGDRGNYKLTEIRVGEAVGVELNAPLE